MKNRIDKRKASKRTKANPTPEFKTEYVLSLELWTLDKDGMGDGDDVASATVPVQLFADILSRAAYLGITPGKFLEEMVTDSVRYDSVTVQRLRAA